MATLTITARFPLGSFLGHVGKGQRAALPDTARLHAALLHAAGKGTQALVDGDELRPSPRMLTALQWLEDHPPESLTLPTFLPAKSANAFAYRDDGTLEKNDTQRRKTQKPQSDATSLGGPIKWHWRDEVPTSVADALAALCVDVSCLGESDSPVIVEASFGQDDSDATHHRDQQPTDLVQPGGIEMRTPRPGRVAELEVAYRAGRPARRPSLAADKPRKTELPSSPVPPTEEIITHVYRSRSLSVEAPWTQVHLLRFADQDPIRLRRLTNHPVATAVAMHRALVRLLPDQIAPPEVTGAYAKGVRQPANRVAIHVVDGRLLGDLDLDVPVLAIMTPKGMAKKDGELVAAAIQQVRRLHLGHHPQARSHRDHQECFYEVAYVEVRNADQFWPTPIDGYRRTWVPAPSLVPEIRRPKDNNSWTLAEATLLSVAHVFRDALSSPNSSWNYSARVAAARSAGVQVFNPHLIPRSDADRHVHRVPKHLVVQPYRAVVDIGELVSDTTLFALGQSRHLGGGLMLPLDVPEAAWPFEQQRGVR